MVRVPRPAARRICSRPVAGLLAGVALALAGPGCNQMNSQALNSEGVRLYQLGNYQQAADQFLRAIASDPRSATSHYNLAAALHKSGKLAGRQQDLVQAEQQYNQCLEYDPNHAECYRGLAVLLSETGRNDAAFRLLEGWAARSPQLADPRIELARLLEETNNLEQASSRLVEALTIDPNNARALTALGRLREVSGDRAQALANYQRSLAVNRFQPEIAARVAALQAAGIGAPASPLIAPPTTRTAEGWQPSVRY
jgi:tetratricopeptide (TPR) repeat protein